MVVEDGAGQKCRWELQLKGAGKTPFARSGDGRAVLRSSVREFIASEAMYCLGVSTTRALSLIASETETVMRPWFSEQPRELPDLNDPRLARYPRNLLPLLLLQLQEALKEPDMMQKSICAITCRVAPSFVRVGHLELFGRRARSKKSENTAKEELKLMVEHAIFREYPHLSNDNEPLQSRILAMLREASQRFANLTADWIRVGFTQGNFNSDNCLVGGRTMDYGPFGFIERFERLWNMWTGGGEHYGFLNQPTAGAKNFASFVSSVLPLLDQEGVSEARKIVDQHTEIAKGATNTMWLKKLGLQKEWSSSIEELVSELLDLMEKSQADYTLVWRQLSQVLEDLDDSDEKLFHPLKDCFYSQDISTMAGWVGWMRKWIQEVTNSPITREEAARNMRKVNPKFIPREWMLVQAYNEANTKNHSLIKELHELFLDPYSEGSEEMSNKYYRKAPVETYCGVGLGGTAFMT